MVNNISWVFKDNMLHLNIDGTQYGLSDEQLKHLYREIQWYFEEPILQEE